MKCACFVETCFHHCYRLCVVFAGSIHIISMYTYEYPRQDVKKKNLQRERKFFLLIILFFFCLFTYYYFFFFLMYVTNICRNYSTKQRVNAKLNLYFLHVFVQYVCCILLLCWYTCNQSYIEQFFNLHISTLHPSVISSISFKNQVNMKYMQSVFPLLPFHIMKMSRYN